MTRKAATLAMVLFGASLHLEVGAGNPTACGPKRPMSKFRFPTKIQSVTPKKLSSGLIQYNISFDSLDLPSLKAYKVPAEGKSYGTVFFLCGGPAPCEKKRPNGRIPKGVDVIQFDYLGIGDNAHVTDPAKMTLDAQVKAAKAVIKALNLKDYVLSSWSFGTAVATPLADQVARDPTFKSQQPKSVLLEGTILAKKDSGSEFEEVSRRAWSLLSEDERSRFRSLVGKFKSQNPELSARMADIFLGNDLRRGARFTVADIRLSLEQGEAKTLDAWKRSLEGEDLDLKFLTPLYRSAGCEVNNHKPKLNTGFLFEDGLVPEAPGDAEAKFCKCRTSEVDFDSRDFKIRSPLIYIHGSADPVTPYEAAKLHWKSQDQAPLKTFVTVHDGGHTSVGRYLTKCLDQIYFVAFSPTSDSISTLPNVGAGCEKQGPIEAAEATE